MPGKLLSDPLGEVAGSLQTLERIAQALERAYPPPPPALELDAPDGADAFSWTARPGHLRPVEQVARVPLALLRGIDLQVDLLLDNTRRFAQGLPANNALLWGARGMGKSSLIKAAHADVCHDDAIQGRPALVEIHREDIESLPDLLAILRDVRRRCLLFCDDLSFDAADTSYKSLKAVLEGGIEGRPENVLFYATSNRRHLMARDAIENEQSTALMPGEAVEEKVSLSDRFGLWIGFHPCNQDVFFSMVGAYAEALGLDVREENLQAQAREWQVTRGARSGRVAWQFIQDLAGRLGKQTKFDQ